MIMDSESQFLHIEDVQKSFFMKVDVLPKIRSVEKTLISGCSNRHHGKVSVATNRIIYQSSHQMQRWSTHS